MNDKQLPSKAPDGRSKKRPGLEEHRHNILAAAVELFRRQGSKAVSISQICARAGISRPTFYRCFPDKAALVMALYEQSVNQPVDLIMLQGLRGGESSQSQVQAALDALLDTIFDNARFAELVFIESNDPESPAFAIVNNAFEKIAGELGDAMGRSEPPSALLLKALMAACQWIVHDAIRKGLNEVTRAEAKAVAWELTGKVLFSEDRARL